MNISKLNIFKSIQPKSTEKQNDNSKIENNNKTTRNIDYRSMPFKPMDIDLIVNGKSIIKSKQLNPDENPPSLKLDSWVGVKEEIKNSDIPAKPYNLELMTGKNTSGEKEQVQNYNPKDEINLTKPIDIELMTGKKQKQD